MNDDHLDGHDGDGLWMAPDPLPPKPLQTWGEIEKQNNAFGHWLRWMFRKPRSRTLARVVLPVHLREFWDQAERGEV